MGRPFKCPYCGSVKTFWKGYRKTLKGLKRLRRCRGCKRRWTTRIVDGRIN